MASASLNQTFRRFHSSAIPSDYAFVVYSFAMIVVLLVRHEAVDGWWIFAAAHAGVLVATGVIVLKCGDAKSGFLKLLRDWDALVYIVALFMMTTMLVHQVNPHDVDRMLINWDAAIAGDAVLRWTQTWSTPFLDEIAKIAWVLYFPIAIFPAAVLYRKKPEAFHEMKSLLATAWVLTYACYYILPAQGPLYFKEELGLVDPSAGVVVAGTLKQVVGAMEGTEARNTFPSGHTMIAALVIFVCIRHRIWKTSIIAIPICLGIIFSTIYLRYHYIVDVIVALVVCVPLIWGSLVAFRRMRPPKPA